MACTAQIFQERLDYYKKLGLEHGFTEEELDWVIDGVKRTFRESRHPLNLRLNDVLWAQHNLMLISKINNGGV